MITSCLKDLQRHESLHVEWMVCQTLIRYLEDFTSIFSRNVIILRWIFCCCFPLLKMCKIKTEFSWCKRTKIKNIFSCVSRCKPFSLEYPRNITEANKSLKICDKVLKKGYWKESHVCLLEYPKGLTKKTLKTTYILNFK